MQIKKLINSFKYAFQGIKSAFKTEHNMKIHVGFMIFIICMGIILKIKTWEWIACITCFALVIGAELFNTSIEIAIDIAMPKMNERAKKSKDIAAGGVLAFAIGSAMIGLIIFVPKLFQLFFM